MNDVGELEINTCKFTWKLKDFSKKCEKVSDKVKSPIFKVETANSASEWIMKLYPYGGDEDSEGILSIYLEYLSKDEVQICFEMMFSNVDGVEIKKDHTVHKFSSIDNGFGFGMFYSRNSLFEKGLLVDDTLKITCTIHMNVCNEHEVNIKETILDDYESLFLDGNLSDVTIMIKKRKISAHKSILSARSNVFEAMFNHDMKEKNTNVIKITDVSYDIMKEMLLFIYSGKVEDLKKNAKLLLPAAEKYELMELKALCEESLWKNIEIQNACEVLSIANLYNCDVLKTKIIDYIVKNIKKINKTAPFIELNRTNPELFETIISEIVEKKC